MNNWGGKICHLNPELTVYSQQGVGQAMHCMYWKPWDYGDLGDITGNFEGPMKVGGLRVTVGVNSKVSDVFIPNGMSDNPSDWFLYFPIVTDGGYTNGPWYNVWVSTTKIARGLGSLEPR